MSNLGAHEAIDKDLTIAALQARVAELEASLRDMVSIEPDRHQESMSYFPPHKEGCIWCHAKRLLGLI